MVARSDFAVLAGIELFLEDLDDTIKTAYSGAVNVYGVKIDTRQNPGEKVYLRMWNQTDAVNGTTDVYFLLPCPSSSVIEYPFDEPIALTTALAAACVTNKGGKSGTNKPTGQVDVTFRVAAG